MTTLRLLCITLVAMVIVALVITAIANRGQR